MSAKQLCDALTAAGFDGDDPLDPESLEWAFLQGDDSRRVLAWVCARLRPGNALSATDLELYGPTPFPAKTLLNPVIVVAHAVPGGHWLWD
jgi:HAUS augmin-like complex subunit 3